MKKKWEILTDWKINLCTEDDEFAYFNTKSFIPGQIYRIHRSTGLPVIVEFQKFGCRYNYKMTTTYPRVLICNETADIPIDEITTICVHNIDNDDENVLSESTKTADISGFKDFVIVSDKSYRMNEKLTDIKTAEGLSSYKVNINGTLKIIGIHVTVDESSCSPQGIRVELPTGDEVTIPASYHPLIKSGQDSLPVFIEDEPELKWHKDLAAGEFYIMLNKSGKKLLALIRCIHNSDIEYTVCTSRYNRSKDDRGYYIEGSTFGITIEDAKDCKFIPIKDVKC